MEIHTVNIEIGMPTVARARSLLSQAIRTARMLGTKEMKVIHGYGSGGKGGAIKRDVQRFLAEKKLSGEVIDFVVGEDFSPFNETTRRMVAKRPVLTKDIDYARGNDGITIIVLK